MAELLVLQGKNKGERFKLEDERTFVGREASNRIALNDSSVSRQHCVIEKRGAEFYISDLRSLNGTFVNDEAAENALLQIGDRIRVGDFALVLLADDAAAPVSGAIRYNDSQFDLSKTIRLSREDAVQAMERDFAALLTISEKINTVRDLKTFQRELLSQIFEVVPADEAAIIFADNQGFTENFAARRQDETEQVTVSRTIINRVLNEKLALLTNDVAAGNFNAAQSLIIAQTVSVLCVPLVLYEQKLGAIYLAANQKAARFGENHLRFMTAVANLAAIACENIRNVEFLESENARLREEVRAERNMLGESSAMRKVFAVISKVAPTDSTVLITGESGTGKELAARAIHLNSPRKDRPFVAINCAALNESLLESELFGHERGAFTGAVAQKTGKIELAAGGTLFLDEIGETAYALQAKLLRVLQEREYERVGGTKTLKADVRLVAATNRDLEAEARNGSFRQDLFYRLNVINLKMPALRERREDVLILAENFAAKFARQARRRIRGIASKTQKMLLDYQYPGNVRELENAIERAVVLGVDQWILPEDLPETFWETAESGSNGFGSAGQSYHEAIQAKKKEIILQTFIEARGSYVETAKILDVHPNYLHRLIRNLNIKKQLDEILTA